MGEVGAPENSPDPVLSVLSVLSDRVKGHAIRPEASTRAAIVRALRAGLRTPGSIATAAKLGATDTYQELDLMTLEGVVTRKRDGALALIAAAVLEAKV